MVNQQHSSPLRFCFRGSPTTTTTAKNRSSLAAAAAPPPGSSNPSLTTCVYHTEFGLFAFTWSSSFLGSSLHLQLLLDRNSGDDDFDGGGDGNNPFSFHVKPVNFWRKHGSKKLNFNTSSTIDGQVFWDLSRAKFGPGPEPKSGFYIAIVIDGELVLCIGDSPKEAYAKTKAKLPEKRQAMVLRREHVYGNKLYTTKANFGGNEKEISIDCRLSDDPRLYISVDNKRVLKIKHLKWKFRGNDRIEVEGVNVQVSWDVYNWLFEDDESGYALFMFRFEDEDDYINNNNLNVNDKNGLAFWSQQSFGFGFETKKMQKGLLRSSARSSSSSSLSSTSSNCGSVMEWACMEEKELKGPAGFSLMVYAWKS